MGRSIALLAAFGLIASALVALVGAGDRASAQEGAGVTLFPGGNYVTYLGESRPIEEALAVPRGEITVVFRFDGPTQRWQAWARGVPTTLQQVTELVSGVAYWVNYEGAREVFWAFTGEADPAAAIAIVGGWNSFGYAGENGPIEGMLAIAGIDTDIVFRWDAPAQRWESWSSRLPEALIPFSDFQAGAAYFFQAPGAGEWRFARLTEFDLTILAVADGAIFPAADRVPEVLVPAGARVDRIGFAGGPQFAGGGDAGASVRVIAPMTLEEALAFYRDALLPLSGDGQVGQEGDVDSGFFLEILRPNGQQLGVGINPAGPTSALVEFGVAEDLFPISETERAFIAGLGVPDDLVPPGSPDVASVALLRLFLFEPVTHFDSGFLLDPAQADATFEYYRTLFGSGGGSLTLNESNPTRRVVCYGFPGAFIVQITLDEPGLNLIFQIQLFPNDEGSNEFRTAPCEAGLR